jgi:hypothetical protein
MVVSKETEHHVQQQQILNDVDYNKNCSDKSPLTLREQIPHTRPNPIPMIIQPPPPNTHVIIKILLNEGLKEIILK